MKSVIGSEGKLNTGTRLWSDDVRQKFSELWQKTDSQADKLAYKAVKSNAKRAIVITSTIAGE